MSCAPRPRSGPRRSAISSRGVVAAVRERSRALGRRRLVPADVQRHGGRGPRVPRRSRRARRRARARLPVPRRLSGRSRGGAQDSPPRVRRRARAAARPNRAQPVARASARVRFQPWPTNEKRKSSSTKPVTSRSPRAIRRAGRWGGGLRRAQSGAAAHAGNASESGWPGRGSARSSRRASRGARIAAATVKHRSNGSGMC